MFTNRSNLRRLSVAVLLASDRYVVARYSLVRVVGDALSVVLPLADASVFLWREVYKMLLIRRAPADTVQRHTI